MVQPFDKIKIGSLEVVFWVNEHAKDNQRFKMLSISLTRGWQDTKGDWHNEKVNCQIADLYRLLCCGDEIRKIESRFKQEERNNQPMNVPVEEIKDN